MFRDEKELKEEEDEPGSVIESLVRMARHGIWGLMDKAKAVSDQALIYFDTAVAHSSGMSPHISFSIQFIFVYTYYLGES